jgi:hypothetical protein
MSYSQHFHDSIAVHGSKVVSYPKSDSGGSITVSYSETVPLDISIDVETDPFDNSVAKCNNSIDLLTGSVAVMNTAQCAAIKQTAAEVSQSLINGFFGAIKTELSQQLQALDSAIKAGFGLLQEQGKAVSEKKKTMEIDYNRISSRYIGIFRDLDSECYKRIYALDKHSFTIAQNIQKKLLIETNTNITAKNLLGIQDESSVKSMIAVSRINRLTNEVLKTLQNYINQETSIADLIDSFMTDAAITDTVTEYIPALWTSRENLESKGSDESCYLPEYMREPQKNAVADKINAYFTALSDSDWTALRENEQAALDKEFKAAAESEFGENKEEKDVRIYNMLMELWRNSVISSTKGALG